MEEHAELSALRTLATSLSDVLECLQGELTHDGDAYQYPLSSDDLHQLRALLGAVRRAQQPDEE